MITTADSSAAETTRTRKPRAAKRAGDQSPREKPDRPAKSKDDSLGKASFYLPREVMRKLVVASVIRGVDQSDIVAALLTRELSSVTYYDRSTRTPDSTLPVGPAGEDRPDVAA